MRNTATVAAVLACGCGTEHSADPFTVTDSAGIRIAMNSAVDAGVTRPGIDLSIGAAEGAGHLLFGRIADVDADGAGNIYVLDAQASEVRMFAPGGTYIRTLGRRGQGPGELSQWVSAVLAGDDGLIYVPDPTQRRVMVFDTTGAAQPAVPIPSRPGGQSWIRRRDGSFLMGGMSVGRGSDGRFTFWEGLLLSRAGTDALTAQLDTITVFDFPHTDVGSPDDIRVPVIVNTAFWTPFGDTRAAWGSLDRPEVRVLDASGTLEQIIRHEEWQKRPLTPGEGDEFRGLLRERLRGMGGDAAAADGRNVTFPDSLPAITSLLAGAGGTLWVQRMGSAADAHPEAVNAPGRSRWLGGRVWDVLDSDGRVVDQVELPVGVLPMRIYAHAIYGVAVDAQGVQRVVRLPLAR